MKIGTVALRSAVLCSFALVVLALNGEEARGVSDSNAGRAADLAAIEKTRQQDIAATLARDPAALTDLWTDDAIRIGVGQPADVGKQAIRATNERHAANRNFEVLSYVSETKDRTLLEGGWAVEWRTFTASVREAPGAEAKEIRGTVLMVLKKLPDGSWKCFRGMGGTEPPASKPTAQAKGHASN
jgi:ketosteroid isomerase-like protein